MDNVLKQQENVQVVKQDMDIQMVIVFNVKQDNIHQEVKVHVKHVQQEHIPQHQVHQVVQNVQMVNIHQQGHQHVHHAQVLVQLIVLNQQDYVMDVMLDMDIPVENVHNV